MSVVGAIAPKLEQAEIERAMRKPTERLDAYDFFLRAMAQYHLSRGTASLRPGGSSAAQRTSILPTLPPVGLDRGASPFAKRTAGWLTQSAKFRRVWGWRDAPWQSAWMIRSRW